MGIDKRLKEERLRLGMSLVDVADLCGVKKQSVHQWESGGAVQLGKIAMLVSHGFDVQYIVSGVRSANLNQITDRPAPEDSSLDMRVSRLSPTQQDVIKIMVEELEHAAERERNARETAKAAAEVIRNGKK